MGKLAFDPVDATITVADNATATPDLTIQLQDGAGNDLNECRAVPFYLSTQPDGSDVAVDGTDQTEIAILTDGCLIETITDTAGWLVCESDGDIGLTITVADGKSVYLVLIMPDGRLVISDELTWAS